MDNDFDAYDFGGETDDLEAFGQQESWEDSRAEMFDSCDDSDVEYAADSDDYAAEWHEPEDSYLDASYEDRMEYDGGDY